MEVEIWAEKQNKQKGINNWKDLMTDEEYETGKYYSSLYTLRQSEVQGNNKDLWDRLIELYACQRAADPDDPDYPNNFIAIITPVIEGQVASIIEGDIEISHVTDNPAHQPYMVKYDAAGDYARRKNKFIDQFKDFTRQYELLGNAVITPSWEDGYSSIRGKPIGFPRLTVCPLLSVIVDGRIKDAKDIQYAEYIIHEIGFQSLSWARKEYGDEKVDALSKGYSRYDGENPDISVDDQYSFTLLHVWTRNNKQHNLQLIEMDSNGFVLRMSDPSKPYYKYVDNEYPFYFSRMIPIVGQFYGYGDGQILMKSQEGLNNLFDEMELACRFSAQPKIIVDPRAKMGADQLDSNPANIAVANNPRENIMVLQAPGLNPVVFQAIEGIRSFAPESVRFSPLMTGVQQGVSATATQINSQMMQGHVGISDKKSDIARAMEWVDRYCLKLCMEYWDKPFWASIGTDYTNAEFVDFNEMIKVPSAVPVQKSVRKRLGRIKSIFGGKSKVNADLARDDNGDIIKTYLDFETKVYIGKGIARGKTDIYNILQGLAGTRLTTQDGRVIGVIDPERWIALMEQTLGMKLKSDDQDLAGTQFDQSAITGQNPIGNNDVIQKPQQLPPGLMQNVAQMAGGDNRKTVI